VAAHPDQFLIMGPPLAPVWVVGLWRLARDPSLARWRFVAFAAGAPAVLGWARERTGRLVALVTVSAAVSAVVTLPIIPAADLHATPVPAMNYDAGEQLGWPRFAATVDRAFRALPPAERSAAIVLTGNYGEAGAVRCGAALRPGHPARIAATTRSGITAHHPPTR
jgi:hypothetical protein